MKSLEEIIEEATASFDEQLGNDLSIKEREMYLTSYLFGWLQSVYEREYKKQDKLGEKKSKPIDNDMSIIKFEDISDLIYALSVGKSHIEITKDKCKNLGEWCIEQQSYIKKGFDVITKLRKELRLPDDPLYNNSNR